MRASRQSEAKLAEHGSHEQAVGVSKAYKRGSPVLTWAASMRLRVSTTWTHWKG